MVVLSITDEQAKLVYAGLKELVDTIWDDAEVVGIDEDNYESDQEYDAAIMEYIEKNINPIVDQINKQVNK